MAATLSIHEEAQLSQTIEMFEVITRSQPLDYQSLEILKEAYLKLGRQKDALATSKRIASTYVQLGQLSSAILEYETILQRHPDDPDVKTALAEIEHRATSFSLPVEMTEPEPSEALASSGADAAKGNGKLTHTEGDNGREVMYKLFVEGKHIAASDFDLCWSSNGHDPKHDPVPDPFISLLAQRQLIQIETALKLVCERARVGFLSLDKYDVDVELARSFPKDVCQRWCLLPFDRMSKSIFVATANPFNKQAARDLEQHTKNHLIWYVTQPQELARIVRKICR